MLFEIITQGCLQFHLAIQKQSLFATRWNVSFQKDWGWKIHCPTLIFFLLLLLLFCIYPCSESVEDLRTCQGTDLGSLRRQKQHQEDSLGLWLHAPVENIQFVYDPANDLYQVVYGFQDTATRDGTLFKEHTVSSLSFWKSPQGEGVEWEPTFLHEALIKPSVEGKTGLDSWPFPTSTQLVHLKRPCDRNSMPQEIECSCDPVVCFSVTGLFFLFSSTLLFHTFAQETRGEE